MGKALWLDLNPQSLAALPQEVRGWVDLEASMTAAVSSAAGGPIEVCVKRQEDGPLHGDEQAFFPPDQPATLREVCLSGASGPLLVARTVFTSDILRTHPRIVTLGAKPLGALLFEEGASGHYTARQFCRITRDSPLFELVRWRHSGPVDHYWGRRTLFWLYGAPLLVTEIMLPELISSEKAAQALRAAAA